MAEVELQQIGPYQVTGLLRVSPTSNFYQGKQRKKDILIQRLNIPLATPEDKERFLSRTKQLKKLKHRNIVNILDANFDGDHGYLVMEYTASETLGQHFAPGEPIAPDEAKRYLSPTAGALHYAHLSNTLHTNLHPGNLLVGIHNDILLTNFSLTPPSFTPSLDDEGFAIPYMAPEHMHGQPTAASDQYSLAVILYELLCGRRPYKATEQELLLMQQEQIPLPPPSSFNEAISSAVEQVIMQALARDPAERFPHTQAFADHYLSALMGFPVKSIVSRTPRPTRPTTPASRQSNMPHQPSNTLPASMNGDTGTHQPTEGDTSQHPSHPIDTDQPTISIFTSQKTGNISQEEQNIRENKKIVFSTTQSKQATEEAEELGFTSDTLPEEDDSDPASAAQQTDIDLLSDELLPSDQDLNSIVTADLCQGGILSRRLPGYEERPAQVEMASLVSRAITQYVPAIIEAGTGTGKSLAYLVPVVRSGQVAIISTANKALQEQLFYKDIPFVQKHIKAFEAALVKGVSNYVCLDRVENERTGLQFYVKNREFVRLLDTLNDPHAGFNGDFETLGFQLSADIRSKVATDSDQCAWSKCGYFGDCYVHKMRDRAGRAQVIVVNHTLLLLDAVLDGYLLPKRDVIILDEAHHLEEEATRCFTITVGPTQLQTLLAQRMLRDHSPLNLQDNVMRVAQDTWIRLQQIADPVNKSRTNLEAPLEEGLHLASLLDDLAASLDKQRPTNLEEKETQLYDKLLSRTQNLASNIRTVFSVADPNKFVYYAERIEGSVNRGFVLQASAAPLDITSFLKERLFDKCNVICTSATLATTGPNPVHPEDKGPNFAYFRRRVGLDPLECSDVLENILPLTFDYEQNALLYLPRDLPAPTFGTGSDDYMKAIAREMYKLVKLSQGRAFLLFSSRRMLDRAYELMSPHLPYPLLKQGDMTRLELTQRFRQEEGAVLFGLKSFWEGVDIAGDALSLVVIDKLPFDPPDDPVHEARVAQMKAAGENWFGTYVLPQAVLRLKQGIGRLLRTREDRGVMAILDTRLHTKGYGKLVLDALPPARRTNSLRDVERFFL
ncbi:MAG TPA: helicase C-terminal domain-containing protein [Ktedonobacteraceae bacterium]|nr:helicase C-terminal domain-containing protein [Ktedonobacteraceae bacterium]